MKVIIAGGGTGGHIFPAIAIANALLRIDASTEILFVGANGKMEMEKVPKEGFKIIGLDVVGFNRSNILKNLSLPFKLWKSRKAALQIIKEFQPNVVVGVGGFASFPILNAAQSLGIPTLIQEQNSFAGKTNKILGKKAKAICVAYDNMEQFFPKESIIKTGNPVRAVISQAKISQEEALAKWNWNNERITLLVVGGSLGAKTINEAIANNAQALADHNIQVIWQTGKNFVQEAAAVQQQFPNHIKAQEFIYDMEAAYAACDMIVSRAGALAIAEICIAAKPTVFVPYPFAAEDHQTSNAKALWNNKAAWIVEDKKASVELLPHILELGQSSTLRNEMTIALRQMAIADADQRIAEKVRAIANK